jgi:hypothetical protein
MAKEQRRLRAIISAGPFAGQEGDVVKRRRGDPVGVIHIETAGGTVAVPNDSAALYKYCGDCAAEGRHDPGQPVGYRFVAEFYRVKADNYAGGYRYKEFCREHTKQRTKRDQQKAVQKARETGVTPKWLANKRTRELQRYYRKAAQPRAERQQRLATIRMLHKQGVSNVEIARRVGVHISYVGRVIKAQEGK